MSDEETAEDAVHDEETDAGEPETEPEAPTTDEDAETETEVEDEDEEPPEDALEDGDFVRVAYTARTVEGGDLVDTTDPDVAEEEGVADQGTFEPRTIVLGAGHIFERVEEAIIGQEVGTSGTVTIPPSEAFGEYDQEEVRTVSADRIPEDDRYPGAQVQVDGEQGYLETIIGGRARVDFNHPLAGEEIEYDYEVLELIEDDLERARGLLGMFLDIDLEMHIETDEVEEEQMVEPDDDGNGDEDEEEDADAEPPEPEFETVTVEKRTLYVEATPQLSFNQQWMFQKQQIAQQIIDRVGLDRVIIQETIDGSGGGMGMGGMMGGMGGAGAGPGAAAPGGDVEAALEDADVDAEEIMEEIEGAED
jgi:FKBP-type peptidyl-prolyl cis-trans isomerase SlyD